MYIKEAIQKHSKYKYTYYQNTHIYIYIYVHTHTHTHTHTHICKISHTNFRPYPTIKECGKYDYEFDVPK